LPFTVGAAVSKEATLAAVVATLMLLMLLGAWIVMPLLARSAAPEVPIKARGGYRDVKTGTRCVPVSARA
jgi:hypothetical protein